MNNYKNTSKTDRYENITDLIDLWKTQVKVWNLSYQHLRRGLCQPVWNLLSFLDKTPVKRRSTLGGGSAPQSCPLGFSGVIHMPSEIVLASSSEIRARILRNAGLEIVTVPARIDEEMIRQSLSAEGATPRDLADFLAESKALKVSSRLPGALCLGADQVLELKGKVFSKPESPEEAISQLSELSGQTHRLLSALVVVRDGAPLWRHVGEARLTVRPLSAPFIADYVAENWEQIRHCVGCYRIEAEGIRLFSAIQGDLFTVQGLPLLPLLNWLHVRGDLDT